jgi:uncharacterized protein (DUF1778 family)
LTPLVFLCIMHSSLKNLWASNIQSMTEAKQPSAILENIQVLKMMNYITSSNEIGSSMPRERVTARVPHDVYTTIHEAAALSGTTVNSFIIQVALQHAQDLIDKTRMRSIKLVNDADVAWFLSKIEEPFKPNNKLENALRRYQEVLNDNTSTRGTNEIV